MLKNNIKQIIKNVFLNNWHIFLLCLVFIIPFIISHNSDFSFFIGFEKFDILNLFQVWINKDLGIIPGYLAPIYFIYHFMISIFGHNIGSVLIWWILYIIGSLFTILSFREVLKIKKQNSNKFSEFLVGFFYVFFIPLQYLPNSPFSFNLAYILLPLLSFVIFKFTNSERKNIIQYSIITALILLLTLGIQIVFLIFLVIGLTFIIIYLILEKKIKITQILKLFSLSFLIYALLSFPYYYETLYLPLKTQSSLVTEILTIENLGFTQSNSFLREVYKILGGTSYYYYFNGTYSIPSAVSYFKEPLYIILSYIGILFFAVWILVEKNKNLKITMSLLFLVSMFFMAGTHSPQPLSNLYNYLYNHFPIFSMFRNGTKMSFMVLFVYSIALGFLSNYFINKIKNKYNKNIVFLLFFIPILLIAKPLYQSNFYSHANIKIPNDIIESIDYINKNIKNGRALIAPITPFPVYNFTDRGVDPYELSTNMNVLTNVSSAGVATKLLSQIKDVNNLDINDFKKIFKKLNINYIIWNNYLDTEQYQLEKPSKSLDFYKKNFKEIKNFNNNIIIFEL